MWLQTLLFLLLIPVLFSLSVFLPYLQVAFTLFWLLALTIDLLSTYQLYLIYPNNFTEYERNKLFIYLTEKLGFKTAAAAFPIIVELPLLLFLTLLPLPMLHSYLFPNLQLNLLTCFTTSLSIAATAHLQAAYKNLHRNSNKSL